jgi:hypothetical protein
LIQVTLHEKAECKTVLPNLTAEDLKELGVSALGHRRKILDAIVALRNEARGKALFGDATSTLSATSAHPEDRAERRREAVSESLRSKWLQR